MRSIITSILLAAGLTATAQNKMPGKVHLGLIYPISSNGTHAPLDTNNLSINLLGGISAEEKGLSFAGISNVVKGNTHGAQFAGFSNHILKKASGAQFAGFMNTYGEGDGFAFAGFTNIASGNVKGGQFAGFANIARDISASQLAGFINTAKDVKGSQLAGFINVARKVKGVQIAGFINVADSSDHPIGLINIIKNGEKSIGLSMDETQNAMLTFRSGGKVLYGILGIGYNFKNKDEVYAIEAGFGAHFFQSKSFRLNAEATALSLEDFKKGEYFKTTLRVLPAFKITPFLEIFAGPSINYVNTNTLEGRKLTKKYLHQWENKWGDNLQGLYAGYTGGIHVVF
ncbi:hypothetical protein [Pedobacter frigoris]|uniref:hypothetical protein n=1 Tax=Pedobacter frigoris TaxID=2571272 RepID=UPI00292E1BB3|nr:hypothetical protein [Pedobacter frigoris]